MKNTTIFLIRLPAPARDLVQRAAKEVFPGAQFISTRSVTEAVNWTIISKRQLLILTDQDESEVNQAAQVEDHDGLPRWAVVALSRNSPETVVTAPMDDCTTPMLARLLRTAVQQHDLARENLQLRGDLKTIAQRFRHDLLSPLNCINMNCELIQEMLDKTAGAVRSQIGVIRDSLSEICQLIDRVSEVLHASCEPKPGVSIQMEAVIENVLVQLEKQIAGSRARVELPAQWPLVTGVERWLEVIWLNLLVNALKHGRAAAPVRLGWNRHLEDVRFWVLSHGAALPGETEAQLFQRFDRLHVRPGGGLGLSLVHRLVSLQGGRCGYERLPDDSSKFYFIIRGTAVA